MGSLIAKRSLIVRGLKTSVSLEPVFWDAFKEMASAAGKTINDLASEIDKTRTHSNLSSAIRLAVFAHFDKRRANQSSSAIDALKAIALNLGLSGKPSERELNDLHKIATEALTKAGVA